MTCKYVIILTAIQLVLVSCYQKSDQQLSPSILGSNICEVVNYCDESEITDKFGNIDACIADQTSYYEEEASRMIDDGGSNCIDLLYQLHQCEIEFKRELNCNFTMKEWDNCCLEAKNSLTNCLNEPSA